MIVPPVIAPEGKGAVMDQEIINLIPTGSKNAVERPVLRIRSGLSDRIMREEIHKARCKIPILNLSDGRGYYIPDMNTETDRTKLKKYVAQEENRIKSLEASLKTAKQTLKNCGESI
jgi:hypothetical protein